MPNKQGLFAQEKEPFSERLLLVGSSRKGDNNSHLQL